jgi:hypothetical protein
LLLVAAEFSMDEYDTSVSSNLQLLTSDMSGVNMHFELEERELVDRVFWEAKKTGRQHRTGTSDRLDWIIQFILSRRRD